MKCPFAVDAYALETVVTEGWRKFEKRQAVRAIDVARAAGVSQSAVSRVFRGGSVSPHGRAKILSFAKALGYRPDAMARAIITRRSGIVGILTSAGTSLNCPDVLTALCRALAAQKMRAMVFVVESVAEIDDAVDQALAYRVDGMIALTDIAVEHAEALSRLGSILVLYDREIEGVATNWVGCDHEYDGEMLARCVVIKGATNLWILEGPATSPFATQRLAGLIRGFKMSPTPMSIRRETGDFSFESGFAAVTRYLATQDEEPHAIVAINNMMAVGAVEALRAAGREVRRKTLIAGFDGFAATSCPSVQITAMTQPHGQLAAAAVEIIISRLQGDPSVVERRVFTSSLAN